MKCLTVLLLIIETLVIAVSTESDHYPTRVYRRGDTRSSESEGSLGTIQLYRRSPGKKKNIQEKFPQGKSANQRGESPASPTDASGSLSLTNLRLDSNIKKPSRQPSRDNVVGRESYSSTVKGTTVPSARTTSNELRPSAPEWVPTDSTIRGRTREDTSGANAGPRTPSNSPPSSGQSSPASSRSSSPKRPSTPKDPEYMEWLRLNKDAVQHALVPPASIKPSTEEKFKEVHDLKQKAKQARAKERVAFAQLKQTTSGKPVSNPAGRMTISKYVKSAERAVLAGSRSTMSQNEAVLHYTDTDRHALLPDMVKSGARELSRTKARSSHKAAIQAEYVANAAKKEAQEKPRDDPTRGGAYTTAAWTRRNFLDEVAQSYQDQHQYKYTKWALGGGDSSSDEDRPFEGVPMSKYMN